MISVVNRTGTKESYDPTRIRDVINWAVEGLDLNALELEARFDQKLFDGIETESIQDYLVNCAVELCSKDEPEWKLVAGRLKMWSRWKHCESHGTSYSDPASILTYIQNCLGNNRYRNNLYQYSTKQLSKAIQWIQPERDLDFDYAANCLLEKRYLFEDELPQVAFLVDALLLALPEQGEYQRMEFAKRVYDQISLRKISLATPLLANLRIPNGSASSCFIIALEDSLESIYRELTNAARISKNGGGIGVCFSKIRATGSDVMGKPNASGGVIPWIKLFNDTAIAVNQGGRRAGAITVALDVWHLDVLEFLEIQAENGDQRRKAHDVFPQLVVPDEFMERVERNDDWFMFCPREFEKFYGTDPCKLWGYAFWDAYQQFITDYECGVYTGNVRVIKAKQLYKQVVETQVTTGLPYIAFKDAINEANPNKHEGYIPCVNLCVAPETKILTSNGYQTIKDLEGQQVEVWNGQEWSTTTVIKTGTNQELLKVNLSNGESIECTPYHKFYLKQSYRSKVIKVEAKDLKPGDKLIKYELPLVSNDTDIELDYAYTHGFFCGDGSHSGGGHPEIDLYHEKRELLSHIEVRNKLHSNGVTTTELAEPAIYDDAKQQRIVCKLPLDIKPKFFVPTNGYTVESRLAWLAGLMDADGTIARSGSNESLQLASVNKEFLLNIRLMLQTLGVDSKVVNLHDAGYRSMPNGKGGMKDYYCQASYRLLISSTGLYKLGTLGFVTNRLKWSVRKPQRNAGHSIKVQSIEYTGRIDDTYCFTEPKRHMGMFNGILTGQCVESFSVVKPGRLAHTCNLVSLVAPNIADDELDEACRVAVRLLDNALEITTNPFMDSKSHNERYRTIGVGLMGLADLLAYKGYKYTDIGLGQTDSQSEVRQFLNNYFEDIAYFCTHESAILAEGRTSYKAFPGSEWSKGRLLGARTLDSIKQFSYNFERWETLAKYIKKVGIRNSHITAIAPNTSSSLMMGCTASILPTYSRFFLDKWNDGYVPIAPTYVKDKYWHYQENKHVDQDHIVAMVSILQRWIDTGISMELVFNPNENAYTDKGGESYGINARDIYRTQVAAWNENCKAIYYIRLIEKQDTISGAKAECTACAG